jgi:hypothetical protein
MYGLPADDVFDMIDREAVILGGCCVTDNDPKWQCDDCGTQYHKENDSGKEVK